jgi:hypothetical protein
MVLTNVNFYDFLGNNTHKKIENMIFVLKIALNSPVFIIIYIGNIMK